ncbi:hypothetical protein DPEC_G00257950 [Dallia pectoralis]|uniref:Uncharacterized protein n=1 Tax=Dallia pectoralis TaxID=75939 RepID=A0ACC2FR05_DALPE|nr:hypothetical protein DPEC_G00257950 [Dallia pectoralis]
MEQNEESVWLNLSEEIFLNFADMTLEERLDVLAELMFSQRKLKQSVSELHKTLEVGALLHNIKYLGEFKTIDNMIVRNQTVVVSCSGRRKRRSLVEQIETITNEGNSSDEEVQEQKEKCVEMEQPVEAVKEKTVLWTHVVRGVKAAGTLTLGLLVPLGILVATLPSYEQPR